MISSMRFILREEFLGLHEAEIGYDEWVMLNKFIADRYYYKRISNTVEEVGSVPTHVEDTREDLPYNVVAEGNKLCIKD